MHSGPLQLCIPLGVSVPQGKQQRGYSHLLDVLSNHKVPMPLGVRQNLDSYGSMKPRVTTNDDKSGHEPAVVSDA